MLNKDADIPFNIARYIMSKKYTLILSLFLTGYTLAATGDSQPGDLLLSPSPPRGIEYTVTPRLVDSNPLLNVSLKITPTSSYEYIRFEKFNPVNLKVSGDAKLDDTMVLSHTDDQPITISYDVTPKDLDTEDLQSTPLFLNNAYAQLCGQGLFMLPQTSQDLKMTIAWNMEQCPWRKIASSFGGIDAVEPISKTAVQIYEGSLANLRGTLFIAGNFNSKIAGETSFVFQGDIFREEIRKQIICYTLKIIKTQFELMDEKTVAPPRLITLTQVPEEKTRFKPAGAALQNAIAIQASPEDLKNRADWLHLLSHEIFHTFSNTTVFPYDRVFCEGFTDYMANVCLLKSGLISPGEFTAHINESLVGYYISPLRFFHSYRLQYHSTRRDLNDPLVFEHAYSRGEKIACLINQRLLSASQGKISFVDLFKNYRHFIKDHPDASHDSAFFLSHVAQTLVPDILQIGTTAIPLKAEGFLSERSSLWSRLSKNEQDVIDSDPFKTHAYGKGLEDPIQTGQRRKFFTHLLMNELLHRSNISHLLLRLIGKTTLGKELSLTDAQEVTENIARRSSLDFLELQHQTPILSHFNMADIWHTVDFVRRTVENYAPDQLMALDSIRSKLHAMPLSAFVDGIDGEDYTVGHLIGARSLFEFFKRGFAFDKIQEHFDSQSLELLKKLTHLDALTKDAVSALSFTYNPSGLYDILDVNDDGNPLPFDEGTFPGHHLTVTKMPSFNAHLNLTETFATRKISGVRDGSPAYAAGLRNGQTFINYRWNGKEIITISIQDGDTEKQVTYSPFDGKALFDVPQYHPVS